MPGLRHTPLRELYRLAGHMRDSSYQPGQSVLPQITSLCILNTQMAPLPPLPVLCIFGTRVQEDEVADAECSLT